MAETTKCIGSLNWVPSEALNSLDLNRVFKTSAMSPSVLRKVAAIRSTKGGRRGVPDEKGREPRPRRREARRAAEDVERPIDPR